MKKSLKIEQRMEDAIVNMINLINNYSGSSEVSWAYTDFRSDLITSIEETKNRKVSFTEEECKELGKAIFTAFNNQIADFYKDI